jgi:predicted SprT family Zn-dependent metalloprotease
VREKDYDYWCIECSTSLDTTTAFNHEYDEAYYCPTCFETHVIGEEEK